MITFSPQFEPTPQKFRDTGVSGSDGGGDGGGGDYIGEFHCTSIRKSENMIYHVKTLIAESGGRCSGVAMNLKEIMSKLERPFTNTGRRVFWDTATVQLIELQHGWFRIIAVRWPHV